MSIARKHVLALLLVLTGGAAYAQETLTLQHAVELAVKKSAPAVIADTDAKIAQQDYKAIRGQFLPQASIGSGIGYSRGFPLSLEGAAPSIFNFNSQESVYNPAQMSFMGAAKSEAKAANQSANEKRSQITLETSLVFMELVKVSKSLDVLQQLDAAANQLEKVTEERAAAGVDSSTDVTRAKLAAAKARLAIVQSQGQADALRLRLSQLTGIDADKFTLAADSIPDVPEPKSDEDVSKLAIANSFSVKAMQDRTVAMDLRAKGEHRAMLPSFDFAAQYAVLAKYN